MSYFANRSEATGFENRCSDCIHKNPDAFCPVYAAQFFYNYKQQENDALRDVLTSLVNEKGECQMRKYIVNETEPKKSIGEKLVFGSRKHILANMKG